MTTPPDPTISTQQREAGQALFQSVLVTGASGGIGRAISEVCAAMGNFVGVHYHQSSVAAAATLEAVQRQGGRGELYQADVRSAEAVDRLIATFCRDAPPPYAFVCNAGIAASSLVLRQPDQEWDAVIQTNLTGTFHCVRAMAPPLIAQGGGSIVVIGSHAGFHGVAGQAAYAASKAGLIGLVKTAAQEWGPQHVRINLVLPGWQRTGLTAGVMPDDWTDHALGQPPDVHEVARTIVHLLQLQGVSGQIWNCDSRNL